VVDRVVYMGSTLQVLVQVEGIGELQAVVANNGETPPRRGERISLGLPADSLRVLEKPN
jgi:hypothetical protein